MFTTEFVDELLKTYFRFAGHFLAFFSNGFDRFVQLPCDQQAQIDGTNGPAKKVSFVDIC